MNASFFLIIITFWFPFIAYAEIHFKPRFLFSRYYLKEPEIIFDIPHRAEDEAFLPVFLLIKDADKFPVKIEKVTISLIKGGKTVTHEEFLLNSEISRKLTFKTFPVKIANCDEGLYECRAECTLMIGRRYKKIQRDNYRLLPKIPLLTYIARERLKLPENFLWGDLHFHSSYTDDPVEFGAPVSMAKSAASCLGLGFFAVTDHSYDLDDLPGKWNQSDKNLHRWKESREEIEKLNSDGVLPLIIPGEEVTVRNEEDKNVHMLVLNHPEFLPGDGDGAEKLFNTFSQLSFRDVLKSLGQNSIAMAAHPQHQPPLFQKLFIKRGIWKSEGDGDKNLAGYEILNGKFEEDFFLGLEMWKKALLNGNRQFIYAGNDAHGNFNLFRQIKYPLLRMRQNRKQIFGKCKTGLWINNRPTVENLIRALKGGNMIISNGPYLKISILNTDGKEICQPGEQFNNRNSTVSLQAHSSHEFGSLKNVSLILGDKASGSEKKVFSKEFSGNYYKTIETFKMTNIPLSQGYIRAELKTNRTPHPGRCYTNPIWFKMGN